MNLDCANFSTQDPLARRCVYCQVLPHEFMAEITFFALKAMTSSHGIGIIRFIGKRLWYTLLRKINH